MNPINYATLEQSKRMKELGYPQDKTDCVWVKFVPLKEEFRLIQRFDSITKNTTTSIVEWFAAPNAQEIELELRRAGEMIFVGLGKTGNYHSIGLHSLHHAQARAAIWEKEKEKEKETD